MMRNVFLFILFLICKTGDCQYLDFSILGKTIHYSDTLKNAVKFKSIDEALLHPENVFFLDLFVEASGKNYDEFIVHQSSFKNLRKLVIINSLEKTHWPVVPDFSNFKFLEFLQVFCLSEINTSQFENLTNLKFLELHSCGIRTFPASILKLKKLECLNLSLNFLSQLPSEMNNLVALRELELTNNCFEEVPFSITQIKNLECLIISNTDSKSDFTDKKMFCINTINEFPDFLGDCKNLKIVYLCKLDKKIKQRMVNAYKGTQFY